MKVFTAESVTNNHDKLDIIAEVRQKHNIYGGLLVSFWVKQKARSCYVRLP